REARNDVSARPQWSRALGDEIAIAHQVLGGRSRRVRGGADDRGPPGGAGARGRPWATDRGRPGGSRGRFTQLVYIIFLMRNMDVEFCGMRSGLHMSSPVESRGRAARSSRIVLSRPVLTP